MLPHTPPNSEDAAAAIDDLGLRCPQCDYNLTGLTSSRCPECGLEVNLEEIAARSSIHPCAATPWDTPPGEFPRGGFWATWRLAAFNPVRLAKNFPHRHFNSKAVSYSLACFFLAFAIVTFGSLVLSFFQGSRDPAAMVGFVFLCAICAAIACWTCEVILAGLLAIAAPVQTPLNTYHFWRGLAHYTSGFSMLTAAWGVLLFWSLMGLSRHTGRNDSEFLFAILLWPSALFIFGWWVFAWWRIIRTRNPSTASRVISIILVPIAGVAGIVIGVFLSFMLCAACAQTVSRYH